MAKYKDYNYSQTVMLPLSLEEQLVPGTLEYAIHHVIEHRINLDFFNERFKNGSDFEFNLANDRAK
jgi:hypothetical protein